MEFSTLCLNFSGKIDQREKEISYMNFLKLKYNKAISTEEICNIFRIEPVSKEKFYIKNVQIIALYLTIRDTTFLVGLGNFFPDKWISSITGIKNFRQLKKELCNYYY